MSTIALLIILNNLSIHGSKLQCEALGDQLAISLSRNVLNADLEESPSKTLKDIRSLIKKCEKKK